MSEVLRVAKDLTELPDHLFPRENHSEEHISEMVQAMRSGVKFPPIIIDQRGRIVDGFHRWRAHILTYGGQSTIPCVERTYLNEKDVFLDALRENSKHGLRFSFADREHSKRISIRLARAGGGGSAATASADDAQEEVAPQSRSRNMQAVTRATIACYALSDLLIQRQIQQHRIALETPLRRLLAALDLYLAE